MVVNGWISVADEVSKVMGTTVLFSPRIHALHDFSRLKFNTLQKLLLLNLCVAATLLLDAKSPDSPTKDEWTAKVRSLFLINKLSALVRYRQGFSNALIQFERQWGQLSQYIFGHGRDDRIPSVVEWV